jgi:two-component system response regulator NreC
VATTRDAPGRAGQDVSRLGVLLAIVDFPLLASAFREVIDREPDLHVVGQVTNRDTIVEDIQTAAADVVVMECEAFGGFGCATFEAIGVVRAACPHTRIIALDCRCAAEQFSVALTRETMEGELVEAVRSVAAGHTYVSPAIVTRIVDTYVRHSPDASLDDPYESLSEREREILLLASMGHTNRDIARSLQLSEQTVHYHRANMMEKLGLHDRVELLRFTVRRGLLNPANL